MVTMSRWLDVEVGTDEVDLNTLPSNLALVDLQNDNEFKLLVGDLGRGEEIPKLKVFRGAMQISDLALPDLPLGVASFYTSDTSPRVAPLTAVAFSSCIYLYRNLKLFYKYYLPAFELSATEADVWAQLIDTANHRTEAIAGLTESLKSIPQKSLSPQSVAFLSMSENQQLEYLEQKPGVPKRRIPEIACITTLRMNSVDRHSVSALVIGSEDGNVIILEPHTFTILSQAKLATTKRTPYQMVTTGLFSVDYRITVATREKCVCLLKRDWKEGRVLFTTEEHVIALEVTPTDHSVYVICADHTLACYSKKGKKQWCLYLEHRPVSMTLVPILHLGVTLTAVALAAGHVHLYDGKAKRDTLFVRDVASVMKFGRLGQEDHVFTIITASGNLMLKILRRTADFNEDAAAIDSPFAPAPGQKPWLIPKKSKLFLEQSVRERENPIAMHDAFQHELNRLRLSAARALLHAHAHADNCVGAGALEPVRLAAEVVGLGPTFKVTLVVENTSSDKAVVGLAILFHVHTANYKVSHPYIKIPLLSAGSKLNFPTKIEEVFDENVNPEVFFRSVTGQGGERALIKILLLKEGRQSPVLAATVQMPATDPMMLPYDKLQATASYMDAEM